MDSEKANARTSRMWAYLGRQYEGHARSAADDPNPERPWEATDFAKLAEACFWQATGDADSFGLSDVLKHFAASRGEA